MPLEPGTTLGVYELLSALTPTLSQRERGDGEHRCRQGEGYRSTGTELDGDAALRNGVEIELDWPRS